MVWDSVSPALEAPGAWQGPENARVWNGPCFRTIPAMTAPCSVWPLVSQHGLWLWAPQMQSCSFDDVNMVVLNFVPCLI